MNATAFVPCLVAHWAETVPDEIALRSEAEQVTWAEWHARIAELEGQLRKAGVGNGTRVGLILPTGERLLSTLLALYRIGAIACPVNPQFPTAYREGLLARLDCGLLIGETKACDLYPKSPASQATTPVWCIDQPATMIFTSGSTGNPKSAVLSLRNHLENARISNANIPLSPGDTWLLSLPMHHVAGFGVLFRCLLAGATIALPEPGVPLSSAIEASGATHISLVARQLAQLPEYNAHLASLKAILLGGSAIPAPLIDRALTAGLPIHTSYGMTETASQIAATPPGASRAQLASSGRPLAEDAVRIDEGGCIQMNGPTRFLGYWRDGVLKPPFDDAGWFTTSDCGYLDDEGFLHVTGRKDNVFIAGGENIQPEEIERVLCELPGVSQAIVVPVAHPEFGATPVAFVECAGAPDAAEISEAMLRVLPRFKVPHHFYPWPGELTGGGMKVSRAALARRAADLQGE
jgi:O-succinylbenzoic acid--CoA ligase